jgi:hypothetical protein
MSRILQGFARALLRAYRNWQRRTDKSLDEYYEDEGNIW